MTDSPSKRLFILDGMALAYRAHFAFFSNPIRNSKGVNTSAVYGFANTLLGILEHERPTHIAACFDTSAPTARHKLYPAYKANRESMPEELSDQMPLIFRLLEAMNIPILRYEGYEADDTIGTLARIADCTEVLQTYIVAQANDPGQLISSTCFLWKPGKRGNDHEVIDLAKLKEQWGIERADQVVDILALMGDSSDNIPGLPGVGEKTAKLLIGEFGSVENLLSNTDKLKGKRKQIVEENGAMATLSKQLATIVRKNCRPFSWSWNSGPCRPSCSGKKRRSPEKPPSRQTICLLPPPGRNSLRRRNPPPLCREYGRTVRDKWIYLRNAI